MAEEKEFTLESVAKQEAEKQSSGVGMSIEEVQALLAKKNETIVDKDDPILLTVTILNAFLNESKTQQDKYMLALKGIYSEQVNDFLEKVEESTEKVEEKLKSVSTEGLIKIYERQNEKMYALQAQLRNSCIIIGVLVLLNIAVMVWR